ncbi:MAG: FAD-dependent oxidoreductase, partial [Alphaproteobacteria bacterium]|nr:FAD-dependent oxidoreductase [Alphaproteobacteria bacterium]
YCDVLVVGGGPAGLAAARATAGSDARVVLLDDRKELGGTFWDHSDSAADGHVSTFVSTAISDLKDQDNVRILTRTTAFGAYDQNYVCAVERRAHNPEQTLSARSRIWHIRAKAIILATGAQEQPMLFPENDRPGIMLASAASAYLNRYGVQPGAHAVVFTNNDAAYRTASDLSTRGITVCTVVDTRINPQTRDIAAMTKLGVPVMTGARIIATRGRKGLTGVSIAPNGSPGSGITKIDCDLLAVSGGWAPNIHLHCHTGGKVAYDEDRNCFLPSGDESEMLMAGGATGQYGYDACIEDGLKAGFAAVHSEPRPSAGRPSTARSSSVPRPSSDVQTRHAAKCFVDLQNDVTVRDIQVAASEGYRSVEHLKRYTTTGMGTDQGRLSNFNALSQLSVELDQSIAVTGITTYRPPYVPVTLGALAGRHVGPFSDPVRVTPMYDRHVELGAVFENVGQWKRPWYYPRGDEVFNAAVRRECRSVRTAAGVLDASTLGKIDIQGSDAAAFLARIYTNEWSNLAIGSCRYGMMCGLDGMVFDDGVTARLGETHFLMTTTTGNAGAVFDWLEEWLQTEWPELRVYCTSVTDQWATISVAGPRSRDILRKLHPSMKLEAEDFPFMSYRGGSVAGLEARVFRVSFTGELSFEINVASRHGPAMWDAVMEAGNEFGITPYGTETMHVLRAEKGFIAVGHETDGTVTPCDLGMDWIVSRKKADFIGKRSLSRPDTARRDRKQLVGLLPESHETVIPEGTQLTQVRTGAAARIMVGHVTSSYYSTTLEGPFALALLEGGLERTGDRVWAQLPTQPLEMKIVDRVFYDQQGTKRDG